MISGFLENILTEKEKITTLDSIIESIEVRDILEMTAAGLKYY